MGGFLENKSEGMKYKVNFKKLKDVFNCDVHVEEANPPTFMFPI